MSKARMGLFYPIIIIAIEAKNIIICQLPATDCQLPTAFALKELSSAEEKKISALVKKAVS
jgi:hypothetical protein